MASVNKNSIVKCQWCTKTARAQEWNDNSYKECTSREMRRDYRDIFDIRMWYKNSTHYYKCPHCSMWSRGDQLLLLDDNGGIVRSIGCQPILQVHVHD